MRIGTAPSNAMVRGVAGLVVTITFLLDPVSGGTQGASPEPSPTLNVRTGTSIEFPRGIGFTVDLSGASGSERSRIELHYTIAGNETDHLVLVPDHARSRVDAHVIEILVDLQSQFVPSGVTLDFHWEVVSESGEVGRTNTERVAWVDTRWTWETTHSDQVTLHSYGLTTEFVQTMLGSAQATITDLEARFALERSQPLAIWVYPSIEDYRGAQQSNSRESIAGASYPGYFLIVAVISEGNGREVGRVVPHEISHQVLYQATKNPFTVPPLWFDEGLATHYQVGGTDGYLQMVIAAYEQRRLFELGSLDTTFPYLPAQATLAYAASWSAVEFVGQRFGDEGIQRLIAAFATGESFDTAVEIALGMSMIELNDQWQAWIAQQATGSPATNQSVAHDLLVAA